MSKAALIACIMTAPALGACTAEHLTPAPDVRAAAPQSMMLAPSTCAPPSVTDGAGLIPDGASAMMALDVRGIMKGAFGTELHAAITSTADGRDGLATLKACGLNPDDVERITMASDLKDGIVIAIEAKGIGKTSTIDCLHDAIEKKVGSSPWTKTTKACTTALEFDGDDGVAYAAGKNTLVVASKSFDKDLQARLTGRGTPALAGTLKWAKSSLTMGKSGWFAVDVPSSASSSLPVPGVERVGASIDASKGLALDLSVGMGTQAQAEEIENNARMLPAMGPMMGVPTGITDSLKIDRDGSDVSLEVFVSPEDLKQLKTLAGI